MEKDLILTCDTGTTGCKCTIFTPKGEALCSVRRDYPTQYPHPNWAEQDPEVILRAMYDGIRELLKQVSATRIACIGLSGTMDGCIPVDAAGKALYPNIIHSDGRSEKQVEEILRHIIFEEFYKMTGNRPDTHYTLPKILWLKENKPEVYRRARWYLNIKDFLYGSLTGRWGYTDYSDASLTSALDINKRAWADALLQELDVDPATMPTLLKGHDVRGKITREVYRQTGLITGTPVAIGGGDGACATRGAGVAQAGSAYTNMGSSAWVCQLSDRPLLDPKARIFNWVDMNGEDYHVCGTVQCSGSAFDWGIRTLLGGGDQWSDVSLVENLARQVGPGAEGVLFLPTLMGWRTPYWDANTKGCLMGFSLYHGQRHIARALYEGVAFALNSCLEVMVECGAPAHSMMLIGGGARSGLWPDMLASIYGVTIQVHRNPDEATSLGAAIAAGVGVGLFSDYTDAASMVTTRSTHPVNPQWQAVYRQVYPIYADIYERLRPLNDRIAALDFNA